jgi:hypothetical protein
VAKSEYYIFYIANNEVADVGSALSLIRNLTHLKHLNFPLPTITRLVRGTFIRQLSDIYGLDERMIGLVGINMPNIAELLLGMK